jgi:hypothetical protein
MKQTNQYYDKVIAMIQPGDLFRFNIFDDIMPKTIISDGYFRIYYSDCLPIDKFYVLLDIIKTPIPGYILCKIIVCETGTDMYMTLSGDEINQIEKIQ